MKRDQFEQTVIRLGSDVEQWPDDLRDQARRVLANEPEARKFLGEWQAHDALLRKALIVDVRDSAITGTVLAGIHERKQAVLSFGFPRAGRLAVLGFLSAASGIAAGVLIARLDELMLNARIVDMALGGGIDLLTLL